MLETILAKNFETNLVWSILDQIQNMEETPTQGLSLEKWYIPMIR